MLASSYLYSNTHAAKLHLVPPFSYIQGQTQLYVRFKDSRNVNTNIWQPSVKEKKVRQDINSYFLVELTTSSTRTYIDLKNNSRPNNSITHSKLMSPTNAFYETTNK